MFVNDLKFYVLNDRRLHLNMKIEESMLARAHTKEYRSNGYMCAFQIHSCALNLNSLLKDGNVQIFQE